MGWIGKRLVDLLRFQLPIDNLLGTLVVIFLLVLLAWLFLRAVFQPLWHSVIRPLAAASGLVPPTDHDHLVRAWEAERRGDWSDALRIYDLVIGLFPNSVDAVQRRNDLLAAHPELVPETPNIIADPEAPRPWRRQ